MLESRQCDSTLCGGKSCACVAWIELHGTCDRSCDFHLVHTYMYMYEHGDRFICNC